MNRMEIAECMANDKTLLGSAFIAKGIKDAMEAERKLDEEKAMARIARSFAEKPREDRP